MLRGPLGATAFKSKLFGRLKEGGEPRLEVKEVGATSNIYSPPPTNNNRRTFADRCYESVNRWLKFVELEKPRQRIIAAKRGYFP